VTVRRLSIALMFAAVALFGVCSNCVQAEKPAKKYRALMLTQSRGFEHQPVKRKDGELSVAEVAITQLGQQSGLFTVDCTQNSAADFTKENLKKYDLVIFYTQSTGALPIKKADSDYFVNVWLKQKGHGFIGFHSAADTFRSKPTDKEENESYRWYWDMIGGTFNGHPWNSRNTVTITVHDTKFPAMKPFGKEFQFKDEIYQYRNWQPKKVHMLMSLNMAKCEPKMPYQVPVAWCKNWGDGKVYFNNLGHNKETWANKNYMKSNELAIRWIMGLEEGNADPNPEVSKAQEAAAVKAAEK